MAKNHACEAVRTHVHTYPPHPLPNHILASTYSGIAPPPASQPLPSAVHHLTSLSQQSNAESWLLLTRRETGSASPRVNIPLPSRHSEREEVPHSQNCGFNPSLLPTEPCIDLPEIRHFAHPAHLRKHFDNADNSSRHHIEHESARSGDDDSDHDEEEVTAMLLDDKPINSKLYHTTTGWRALLQNEDITTPFVVHNTAFMEEVADCIRPNVLTVQNGDRRCNRCRLRRKNSVDVPCAAPTRGPAGQPCLLCKIYKQKCTFSSQIKGDRVDNSSGHPASQVHGNIPGQGEQSGVNSPDTSRLVGTMNEPHAMRATSRTPESFPSVGVNPSEAKTKHRTLV